MEFSHKVKVARYLTSNDQERATFEGNQSLWTEDDAIALFEEYSGNVSLASIALDVPMLILVRCRMLSKTRSGIFSRARRVKILGNG
jgi:hypothetical protein